jgi:L-ascorbate metabolism protein UlaG (beta-lactamase superfamily)
MSDPHSDLDHEANALRVRLIGGPTALLEFAGLRLITDPTFDAPGSYQPRPGITLTKMTAPALTPEELAPVDLVLLSHDHHKDNLDDSGREYLGLGSVGRVLTTPSGAGRLGARAEPLANWTSVEIERPGAGTLRVTGVPAQHGPDGSEHITGEVTGFVLSGEGLPSLYISGDNASLEVVRRIHERLGPLDIAILFAGGAQIPDLGSAYITLSATLAAEAAELLDVRAVVPVHFEGWKHFSDGSDALRAAFDTAGIGERLVLLQPGESALVR